MFCINCGKEIEDKSKEYCSSCYNKFNKEVGDNWLYAIILNWLVGCTGAHRFYTGYIGIGIAQFLTLGGLGIWSLVDMVSIGLNKYKNAKGEELQGYNKPIGMMGIAYAVMIVLIIIEIMVICAMFIILSSNAY